MSEFLLHYIVIVLYLHSVTQYLCKRFTCCYARKLTIRRQQKGLLYVHGIHNLNTLTRTQKAITYTVCFNFKGCQLEHIPVTINVSYIRISVNVRQDNQHAVYIKM